MNRPLRPIGGCSLVAQVMIRTLAGSCLGVLRGRGCLTGGGGTAMKSAITTSDTVVENFALLAGASALMCSRLSATWERYEVLSY